MVMHNKKPNNTIQALKTIALISSVALFTLHPVEFNAFSSPTPGSNSGGPKSAAGGTTTNGNTRGGASAVTTSNTAPKSSTSGSGGFTSAPVGTPANEQTSVNANGTTGSSGGFTSPLVSGNTQTNTTGVTNPTVPATGNSGTNSGFTNPFPVNNQPTDNETENSGVNASVPSIPDTNINTQVNGNTTSTIISGPNAAGTMLNSPGKVNAINPAAGTSTSGNGAVTTPAGRVPLKNQNANQ